MSRNVIYSCDNCKKEVPASQGLAIRFVASLALAKVSIQIGKPYNPIFYERLDFCDIDCLILFLRDTEIK